MSGNSGLNTALGIGAAIAAPELLPAITGGGAGSAALMGSALGAGSAALRGGNIAQGALMGGALGYGAGSLDAGLAGSTSAANYAPVSNAGTMLSSPASQGVTSDLGSTYGANAAANSAAGSAPGMSYDSFGQAVSDNSASAASADPTGAAAQQQSAMSSQAAAAPGAANAPTSMTSKMMNWIKANPYEAAALGIGGAYTLQGMMKPNYMTPYTPKTYPGLNAQLASNYTPYHPMAEGGIVALAAGGMPQVGAQYALSNQNQPQTQSSSSGLDALAAQYGITPQQVTSAQKTTGYAEGGITHLNVGGKLLSGEGDGMSDSIKANISGQQEARLGDGEFVVPADVVSHLGNGSTDAGAKQLYSMMDKVRKARTGRKEQGKQINAQKYMPA